MSTESKAVEVKLQDINVRTISFPIGIAAGVADNITINPFFFKAKYMKIKSVAYEQSLVGQTGPFYIQCNQFDNQTLAVFNGRSTIPTNYSSDVCIRLPDQGLGLSSTTLTFNVRYAGGSADAGTNICTGELLLVVEFRDIL